MKELLLFIFIYSLIISACSTTHIEHYPKEVNIYGYDFTKYTAKGFLFTPEKYMEGYESIGLLEIEIFPEANYQHPEGIYRKPGQYYSDDEREDKSKNIPGGWFYKPVDAPEVLDSLYITALKLGADAVINLRINEVAKSKGDVIFIGKKASGFAIKRLSKQE